MYEHSNAKQPESKNTIELDLSKLKKGQVVQLTIKGGQELVIEHHGEREFVEQGIKAPMLRVAVKGEGSYIGIVTPDSLKSFKIGEKLSMKMHKCIRASEGFDLDLKDDGTPVIKEIETGILVDILVQDKNALKTPPVEADMAGEFIKDTKEDIDNIMAA